MTAALEKWKAQQRDLNPDSSEDYSQIGTMHSMLAGVGSGIIQIPKGLFSLGATLMDLGAGTNKAAEVEKYFDDLTDWDEKAEATTAGKITETLVNLGIPGGVAFTKGASLASKALKHKKLKKYFTLTDDGLKKAGKKALELNAKGKTARFIAGATAGGGPGQFAAPGTAPGGIPPAATAFLPPEAQAALPAGRMAYAACLAHHSAAPPNLAWAAPNNDDLLFLLYTGGTTGFPKGVMWDTTVYREMPRLLGPMVRRIVARLPRAPASMFRPARSRVSAAVRSPKWPS